MLNGEFYNVQYLAHLFSPLILWTKFFLVVVVYLILHLSSEKVKTALTLDHQLDSFQLVEQSLVTFIHKLNGFLGLELKWLG